MTGGRGGGERGSKRQIFVSLFSSQDSGSGANYTRSANYGVRQAEERKRMG